MTSELYSHHLLVRPNACLVVSSNWSTIICVCRHELLGTTCDYFTNCLRLHKKPSDCVCVDYLCICTEKKEVLSMNMNRLLVIDDYFLDCREAAGVTAGVKT